MATSAQLPFHLPIFPPEKGTFEATGDEHQCSLDWPLPGDEHDIDSHHRCDDRFQNRLQLWHIIHDLGSNTKARFEMTKFLRPNEGGVTLCYALRRLSTNIQEPYRTLALQAIDNTLVWWKGKPAPRASALRAPWALSPDLANSLLRFLR